MNNNYFPGMTSAKKCCNNNFETFEPSIKSYDKRFKNNIKIFELKYAYLPLRDTKLIAKLEALTIKSI